MKSITFADLETYNKQRLSLATKSGGERSIATVNRELALLRSVFGFAKQSGWIARSPFGARVQADQLQNQIEFVSALGDAAFNTSYTRDAEQADWR